VSSGSCASNWRKFSCESYLHEAIVTFARNFQMCHRLNVIQVTPDGSPWCQLCRRKRSDGWRNVVTSLDVAWLAVGTRGSRFLKHAYCTSATESGRNLWHEHFDLVTDWLIEQCSTSPPTQYRLSGRQFTGQKTQPTVSKYRRKMVTYSNPTSIVSVLCIGRLLVDAVCSTSQCFRTKNLSDLCCMQCNTWTTP